MRVRDFVFYGVESSELNRVRLKRWLMWEDEPLGVRVATLLYSRYHAGH